LFYLVGLGTGASWRTKELNPFCLAVPYNSSIKRYSVMVLTNLVKYYVIECTNCTNGSYSGKHRKHPSCEF